MLTLRLWLKSTWQRLGYGRQIFFWKKQQFNYFVHPYNYSWLNERAVEVPIVWQAVQQQYRLGQSATVLEIGNVLSHYFATHHTIVDKYEVAAGVINQDIINFRSTQKFTLIVAISTLEHVGWDEAKKDRTKIGKAIKHLQSLLVPGGKLLITVPLGYSSYCDDYLASKASGKLKWTALRRLDAANHWQSVAVTKNLRAEYNQPYPNANLILVGEYTRPRIARSK